MLLSKDLVHALIETFLPSGNNEVVNDREMGLKKKSVHKNTQLFFFFFLVVGKRKMVYFTITLSEKLCALCMYQENSTLLPNNIKWRSDTLPSLLDLDPFNKIKSVKCDVNGFNSSVKDKGCFWCIIDRRSGENDVPEKSSASRTLETLTVKDSMLDIGKAALLTTFLSGVVQVENRITCFLLTISPEVNIGHLPFTRTIEFDRCTFKAGSRFFESLSSPSLHPNSMMGNELFDLSLTFKECSPPGGLNLSFLQDIPRIALNVYQTGSFSTVLLEWLEILQSRLVRIVFSYDGVGSVNALKPYVASCCTLLEQSTVLTYLFWSFDYHPSLNRNVHMNQKIEQQQRLFEAAGKAASPVLHTLIFYHAYFPSFLTRKDILRYAPTWSRMRDGLALIGCSEKYREWINDRIRSDRYRLGPVLYAPFVSAYPGNSPLTQLNENLVRTLIETFLPTSNKVVVVVEHQVS